jgi:hypothetical protein
MYYIIIVKKIMYSTIFSPFANYEWVGFLNAKKYGYV